MNETNPASYVALKLLIHNQREAADRAKDILYVHDTIEIFAGSLPDLGGEWKEQIAPALHRNVVADIGTASTEVFQKVTDDIRSATEIAKSLGRTLSPERLLKYARLASMRFLGSEPNDPRRRRAIDHSAICCRVATRASSWLQLPVAAQSRKTPEKRERRKEVRNIAIHTAVNHFVS